MLCGIKKYIAHRRAQYYTAFRFIPVQLPANFVAVAADNPAGLPGCTLI